MKGRRTAGIGTIVLAALLGASPTLSAAAAPPRVSLARTPAATRAPVRDPVIGGHAAGASRRAPVVKVPARVGPPRPSQANPLGGRAAATTVSPSTSPSVGTGWTYLGPKPIQGFDTYGNVSGRVTALAVDHSDSTGNTVYAGSAGGGVWKSSNGGQVWMPLTDSQPSLSIGGLAIDPTNHLTVYASTGEPNRCGDCGLSQGILKSTDGGASWILLGQSTFATGRIQLGSIAVDKSQPTHLSVASNVGLFQSTDAGQTWTQNSSLSALSPYPIQVDEVLQETQLHPELFYAAVAESCAGPGFIAKSSDFGLNWSVSQRFTWAGTRNSARVALAESAQSGQFYAATAACGDTNHPTGGLGGFYTSQSQAEAWIIYSFALNGRDYFDATGGVSPQGDYDNVVAVDPFNANNVVLGGVDLLASVNSAYSFKDIGKVYQGGPVHPDIHAVAFSGLNTMYVGTDGGVWRTSDLGGNGTNADWANLNATLDITTFYSGSALDATDWLGGAQDEGTAGRFSGAPRVPIWNSMLDGDGGWTAIDPGAGSTGIYAEQGGLIGMGDASDPTNWQLADPCNGDPQLPACTEPFAFTPPFLMDPANPSRLFAATNRVYETSTGGLPAGGGWHPISGDVTTGTSISASGDFVSTVAQGAMVVVTASYLGRLNRIAIYPQTGTAVDLTDDLPAFRSADYVGNPWITALAVTPTNADDLWATLGALGPGLGRVWHRVPTPLGPGHSAKPYTWADATGIGLPNAAVTAIAVDPTLPNVVYLGTDAGAYVCTNCGWPRMSTPVWTPLGIGLPKARVDALNYTGDLKSIVAWTHGRGAWSIPRPGFPAGLELRTDTTDLGTLNTGPGAYVLVKVVNTGDTIAHLASLTVTGPNAGEFPISSDGCPDGTANPVLYPGASCDIWILETPSSSGPKAATVTLRDDLPNSPQTLTLTAGVTAPSLTLLPSAGAMVDGVYQAQSVVVRNVGTGSWSGGPALVGQDASSFVSPYTCINLQPGQSCTVEVDLRAGVTGIRRAALQFFGNLANGAMILPVFGNAITFNTTGLDLGPVTVGSSSSSIRMTAMNRTNPAQPLTVSSSIGGNDLNDFSVTATTCSGPLAGGASCTVDVKFAPAAGEAATIRHATLDVAYGGTPESVSLTGTSTVNNGSATLAPASISYPDQNTGTTSPSRVATLVNVSSTNLTGVTASVGTTDYALTNPCPTTLQPGAGCMLSVAFTPTATGSRPDRLTVTSSAGSQVVVLSGNGVAPAIAVTPGSLTFPAVPVGTRSAGQTLMVTNPGSGPLLISSIAVTGANSSQFGETNNCPTTLVPGGSCAITTTFAPSSTQSAVAAIAITDNAGASPQQTMLSGTGVAPTAALTPPGSLTFGNQTVGTRTGIKTATLANTGSIGITIRSIATTADYAETDTCGASLASGTSCTISVSFDPAVAGTRDGALIVSDDAQPGWQMLPLSGSAQAQGWHSLGGLLNRAPASSTNGIARLDAFGVGTDNAMYQRTFDGTSWKPPLWAPLGGRTFADPVAVGRAGGIDLFVQGTDAALWWNRFDGTSWLGWHSLGGRIIGGAAVASWGANRLDLVVVGTDYALWHNALDNDTWSGWESLGGKVNANPGAVSWGFGRLDIFVRGTDYGLWHRGYDLYGGGWEPGWDNLGGRLSSAPAAASWGPGRLDVFVEGTDTAVWHRVYDGGWQPWFSEGGLITQNLSATARAVGLIDLFVVGTDHALWHKTVGS